MYLCSMVVFVLLLLQKTFFFTEITHLYRAIFSFIKLNRKVNLFLNILLYFVVIVQHQIRSHKDILILQFT